MRTVSSREHTFNHFFKLRAKKTQSQRRVMFLEFQFNLGAFFDTLRQKSTQNLHKKCKMKACHVFSLGFRIVVNDNFFHAILRWNLMCPVMQNCLWRINKKRFISNRFSYAVDACLLRLFIGTRCAWTHAYLNAFAILAVQHVALLRMYKVLL